jgi:hypothetical protein
MKIAGGPESYFKALEREGIKGVRPFQEMGAKGLQLPGIGPLAVGAAAGAMLSSKLDRKKIKQVVRQEIEKERKSHTGPGLNGISFF